MKRLGHTFIVLVLVAAGIVPYAAPQPTPVIGGEASAPWWGDPVPNPTMQEFREGWNLRIPLLVADSRNRPLTAGAPVQVHLDLARSLLDSGWPDRDDVPLSFMAYPESVRLVEYEDGWSQVRGDVPFIMYATWLQPDQLNGFYGREQSGPFHGQRNAIVTLEWRLPRALGLGESHRYFVYFDLLQNAGAEPDQEFRKTSPVLDAEAVERLDSLYWIGTGTTVYGSYMERTGEDTILVTATEPNTDIEVYTYKGRSTAGLDDREIAQPKFTLATAGAARAYSLGFQTTHFRIEANKPVAVMTHSDGVSFSPEFVPSREGGLLGWTFDVPGVAPGVYVIKPAGDTRTDISISGSVSIPRSSQGGSQACEGSGNALVLRHLGDGRLSYCRVGFNDQGASKIRTVSVDSGGPILVQFIPPDPTQLPVRPAQAASALGSPVGYAFHASTLTAKPCSGAEAGSFPDGLDVTAWERTSFIDIVDRTQSGTAPLFQAAPIEPPAPVRFLGTNMQCPPNLRRDTFPYTTQVTLDPVGGDPSGPIQVRVGGFGGGDVSQTTPFGGRHGVEFQLQGPFVIYNFYPSTRLSLTHHWDGGRVEERTVVSSDVPLEYDDLARDAVVTLRADKPVSVLPFGKPPSHARFLAPMPDFLVPTVLPGQFRGFLFEVVPEGGVDPVFLTAMPGEKLGVSFQVRNLARWRGEPAGDAIQFAATVESRNWANAATVGTSFDQRQIVFSENGVRTNRVNIDLPAEIPADTQLTIRVKATSSGNPQMFQEFSTVVLVRQNFDVELWFGDAASSSGPREKIIRIAEGKEESIPIVIRNKGSGIDSFDLAFTRPPGGWDTNLVDSTGRPLTRVEGLPPQAQVGATLHVRAPLIQEITSVLIPISAVSVTSPLESDLITLSLDLALEQGVDLTAEKLTQTIKPGAVQRFNITLANTGEDGLAVRLGLDASPPAGWVVEFAGLGDPSQPPISLLPGQNVTIPIDVIVPRNSPADQFVSFLLRAEALGEGTNARDAVSMAAIVDKLHLLNVTSVHQLEVLPGQTANLNVSIENLGNIPEAVRLEPKRMPGGWRLSETNESKPIEPGAKTALTAQIRIPDQELPGLVQLLLQVRSGGPAFEFPVPIRVKEMHDLQWRNATEVVAQPGQTPKAQLRLENRGNVLERVFLQAAGPWTVRLDAATVDLGPGSLRTVKLEWTIPPDAPTAQNGLRITATAESGMVRAITVPVRVDAPRLNVQEIVPSLMPRHAGAVGTILAIFHNPGGVPVENAEVRLVIDAENGSTIILDAVPLQSVGPNGTVVVPLRWVEGEDTRPERIRWGYHLNGDFQLLGDAPMPAAAINPGEHRTLAAPGVFLVAAVVAGLSLLRRRRGAST